MPPAAPGTMPSLILAAVVLAAAVFLAFRQWRERRRRPLDLSEADARHFARQDLRRFLGAVVMLIIALAAWNTPVVAPRGDRQAGKLWASTWLAVGVLVLFLLLLALFDWISISLYARRHRRKLADERRATIEAERQRRAIAGNGRGSMRDPPGQDLPR